GPGVLHDAPPLRSGGLGELAPLRAAHVRLAQPAPRLGLGGALRLPAERGMVRRHERRLAGLASDPNVLAATADVVAPAGMVAHAVAIAVRRHPHQVRQGDLHGRLPDHAATSLHGSLCGSESASKAASSWKRSHSTRLLMRTGRGIRPSATSWSNSVMPTPM